MRHHCTCRYACMHTSSLPNDAKAICSRHFNGPPKVKPDFRIRKTKARILKATQVGASFKLSQSPSVPGLGRRRRWQQHPLFHPFSAVCETQEKGPCLLPCSLRLWIWWKEGFPLLCCCFWKRLAILDRRNRERRGEFSSLFGGGGGGGGGGGLAAEAEAEARGRKKRRTRFLSPLFSLPLSRSSSVFFPKKFSPSAESGFGKERERELPSSPLPLCTLRDPAPTREDPRTETTTTKTDGFP